jgi:hypothetical protein
VSTPDLCLIGLGTYTDISPSFHFLILYHHRLAGVFLDVADYCAL